VKAGDRVRFPRATRPWQSGVLRHRGITIKAGVTGEILAGPFATTRGQQVDVRVASDDCYWHHGRPLRSADTLRLRCSVKELEA